jgi:hypothetical protein
MGPQLIHDPAIQDLVEAFEHLAESARQGLVVGAILGIAVKGRRYHVSVGGTLTRDPTFARGICAAIDDELMHLVHHDAEHSPTL